MRVATVLSAPALVVALMASGESAFAQSPANATFFQCSGTTESREQRKIEIETGHTCVMTVDQSFNQVVLGDSEIADVQVKTDRMVVINAKQNVGTTNLILFNDAGPMYSAQIVVRPQPDAPPPFGRVKIHAVRGRIRGTSVHDYFPYACTSTGCSRLKEEYRGEYSKEIFVPGLRQGPEQNINVNEPSAQPSPQRQGVVDR